MTNNRTSAVIDYTIGRATNETLEQTVAVWFKDEGDAEGQRIGPVHLQVGGEAPSTANPFPRDRGELVPLAKSGDAEWHTEGLAQALADELGVEVVWS